VERRVAHAALVKEVVDSLRIADETESAIGDEA
jgi:hypothetical protein